MIKQTKYWINDLTNNIKVISSCIEKKIPFANEESNEILLDLEKRIMISCYILRKLNESKKITNDLYKTEVKLDFHSKKSKVPIEFDSFTELYNMENSEVTNKYFSFIANQIIHSYCFEISQYFDETISGFYFNSDRSSKKGIYYVRIDDFFEALTDVARVYADGEAYTKNAEGVFVKLWR